MSADPAAEAGAKGGEGRHGHASKRTARVVLAACADSLTQIAGTF